MKIIKEIIPYIVIVLVVVLIRTFIITPVRVDGDSMKNTLKNGDILLLYKLGSINRLDIIVLDEEKDNEKIIKRVIGLPGETVAIKKGKIYINDKVIDDEYAYGETSDYDKVTLEDDEYFILGDNRLISKDSRYFGPIKKSEIKGKIVFRLFPFTKIGTVQ
ncbi:MAG: signal peptidase I [Firmicutes bacterium]|uniref:signal peptidase I n=1 Tax=Candidatus Onthocola sp. TaxID=3085646 RepID=UPI00242761F4|nr:signal peptidase I [Bacillota bacterium]